MKTGMIGLLVTAIFLVVLAGMCGETILTCTGQNQDAAKSEALKWADEMGYDDVHVQCAKKDTDGDSYVSCTLRADGELLQIECATILTTNGGCRLPKFRVPQQGGAVGAGD